MGLTLYLALVAMAFGMAHSSYLAVAPGEFHPGWKYTVQLTVTDVAENEQVQVNGNIFNSKKTSIGIGTVSLKNGETKSLEIQIGATVSPDTFTLQLDGSGGLTFSNSTTIKLAYLTHLVFVQTDKMIYRASQLIRFRVMVVDKDLIPQKIAKNITIEIPTGSTVKRFEADGSNAVYENTYPLSENPQLGEWKIKVTNKEMGIEEENTFMVDEYVLPKFEVTAESVPGYIVKGQGNKVTIAVTATYTYGKGVMGDVNMTVTDMSNKVSQTIKGKITDPSGKVNLEVDLENELQSMRNYWGSINFRVTVKDISGRAYDATTSVKLENEPVMIEFDRERTDTVFRPGMPIKAVVKVTDPAGKVLDAGTLENNLMVSLGDYSNEEMGMTQSKPLMNGETRLTEVEVTFNNVPSGDNLRLKAELDVNGKKFENQISLEKYETLGNATLDARWMGDVKTLTVGGTASFMAAVSNPSHFSSLTYMIVSRGNIQKFGVLVADTAKTIQVTTDMCPQGRLVVYGITTVSDVSAAPEVIADSLNLKLEHCQDKKVTPTASPSGDVRTGSDTTLTMQVAWTDPTRTEDIGVHDVYMLGVDKSLILLQGRDNDLTTDRVGKGLEKFNLPAISGDLRPILLERRKRRAFPGFPYPGGSSSPTSTGQLMEALGVLVMSDIGMKERLYEIYRRVELVHLNAFEEGDEAEMAEMAPDAVDDMAAAGGFGGGVAPAPAPVKVRTNFPDTWIWKKEQTDAMGKAMVMETLPDTITAWVVSAFAVKEDSELGVTAEPVEINAYNPFFVTLNLPYSIRRTEKFELIATVFNYENMDLQATVTLAESNEYTISGASQQTTSVKKNSGSSVTFMIVANKVGTITLKVSATAPKSGGASANDIIEKKLIVKPEGVERMRAITFPVFLPASGEFNQTFTLDFSPWSLADVVADSRRAAVKITGDMMGNALNDIHKLVTQPTGCGEQNMITTVPNIYAWAYLKAVNDLSPEFMNKASGYMKQGYTKEVEMYRWTNDSQTNGGYSAFGTSDNYPSSWLTAFVLKSFAQARNYIPETVDVEILDDAVQFLLRHKTKDGFFFERGRVIHDEMTSDTSSGDALTIYIAICILEAEKYGVEIDRAQLDSALTYITGLANDDVMKKSQYTAAITAYALALAYPNDEQMKSKVENLIRYVDENNGAPWRKQKEPETVKPQNSLYYEQPPRPRDIEITSYCILALIEMGKNAEARDLVLWLQKKQNSNGGFSSTQDTVMALQAISRYAKIFSQMNALKRCNVTVTALDPATPTELVEINPGNSKVLQRIELPDETNKVNIKVTGERDALAVVKVVWYFYTAPETKETPPSDGGSMDKKMTVSTESRMIRPGFHNVEACVTPEEGFKYNNMMLWTIDMPSGMTPDNLQETRKNNPDVVRVEQKEEQLHLYMNDLHQGCMNIVLEETVKVENRKPGSAALYAYYEPGMKAEADITLQVTQCTGADCDPAGHASSQATLNHMLLAACLCLLISLVLAM